eukprot:2789925-Amphidinium_carterae.1
MHAVRSLHLCWNSFTGELPLTVLGRMRSLMHLDVGWNDLSGRVPLVEHANVLSIVACARNRFAGQVPEAGLRHLTALVRFQIFHNAISGRLPEDWGAKHTTKLPKVYKTNASG